MITHDERIARARARVGKVLNGKYRLDRVLGVGGMAAVYASTHLRNASRVAVKVLHPEMAIEESVRARFLREGYAANSVEHAGTVRVLDDDSDPDGSVFLVMELLEGETLDARWERSGRRLTAREVARLMYDVLDVLGAAHAKGVVHRDIKPENLFLTTDGVVKLLDFGVARVLEGPAGATRHGGVMGTPAFMAPEQVLGKNRDVDARSDLFSVGATAFTLLSKRYVHEAETAEEMMVLVGSRPARQLANVSPDVPPPIAAVIDRALMFKRGDRWDDARAMQVAFAAAYREVFDAPMPGSDDSDDRTSVAAIATGQPGALRSGDRTSAAVTVLTGATPVITHHAEPLRFGRIDKRPGVRSAILAGLGVFATIAVGVLVSTVGGSPQPGTSPARGPAAPSAAASAAWLPPSAGAAPAGTEPPSYPVESLPTAWQATIPADSSPRVLAPVVAPPQAHAAPAHPACSPPFTLDPATGKKKWKLECL